jgi:hypothetical protein
MYPSEVVKFPEVCNTEGLTVDGIPFGFSGPYPL